MNKTIKLSTAVCFINLAFLSPNYATSDTTDVIIIGSGVAGLRAGEYLYKNHFKNFIILEAQNHIGGRTYTYKPKNSPWGGAGIDLGASWVHGAGAYNPLTDIVLKQQIPYKVSNQEDAILYDHSGHEISDKQQNKDDKIFKTFLNYLKVAQFEANKSIPLSKSVEEYIKTCCLTPEQQHAFLYRVSVYFEQEYAADITKLSLKYYNSDDAFRGPEWFLTGGYSRVAEYLSKDIKNHIILNQRVKKIDYRSNRLVTVTTENGRVFHAKKVINTLPLGVIKKGKIKFVPELPHSKKQAMSHINMGVQNKIWLKFPKVFWDNTQFIERQAKAALSGNEWRNKGRFIEWAIIQNNPRSWY